MTDPLDLRNKFLSRPLPFLKNSDKKDTEIGGKSAKTVSANLFAEKAIIKRENGPKMNQKIPQPPALKENPLAYDSALTESSFTSKKPATAFQQDEITPSAPPSTAETQKPTADDQEVPREARSGPDERQDSHEI